MDTIDCRMPKIDPSRLRKEQECFLWQTELTAGCLLQSHQPSAIMSIFDELISTGANPPLS